jgi:hypothetical protein
MPAKRAAKLVKPTPPEPERQQPKMRGRLVPITVSIRPEMLTLLDQIAAVETRSRNQVIGIILDQGAHAWLQRLRAREEWERQHRGAT